jgi:progressive ankylosis protein
MTEALTTKRIMRLWVPLALSWMLMAAEGPLLSAAMARLPNPAINLAAYGGIVWPLALIIEAPIIMLLAASTALSTDWEAYRNLREFMTITSVILSVVHILVAFTPLYYFVVEKVIGSPAEIVEPARLGLMAITPWTWAIAYRRFQQGAMIRFGHSDAIVVGTGIRLVTDVVMVLIGMQIGELPGVVVGAGAQALGVTAEAIYSGIRVRAVVIDKLKEVEVKQVWHWGSFAKFYIPLSLTSLLNLIWQPIGSAALSRMPMAIESLAVWPVLTGLVFILRSPAMAFNEVVVALFGERRGVKKLRRVALGMGLMTTLVHLVFVITPLSIFWFAAITGLSPELVEIGRVGLWLALPLPALNMLLSWFQGALVHGKKTRGIPEAVAIYLVSVSLLLFGGVMWGDMTGLFVGMGALGLAQGAQTLWLWYKSRVVILPMARGLTQGSACSQTR